ncbi:MAG: phosphatase PAP2 family protein [Acidimicrobiales bacterium]
MKLRGSADRSRALTESGRRLRWWREVVYILVFYVVYSAVRNTFGSSGGVGRAAVDNAFNHAKAIIAIQDWAGLWFEPELQLWYLDLPGRGGIRAWNIYYGTAHFVVTVATMVVLFVRQPDRYPVWRNTLAAMTALALIGFATFSLMPPRLLDDTSIYGACRGQEKACHGYAIVDTLAVHGGLWSFDSGAVANVSNQYAAMPSLHTGWSTWCALVLLPMLRRRWTKALLFAYPLATVFCILVTGNHYWIDAIGGLAALAGGYVIGAQGAHALERRHQRRRSAAAEPEPVALSDADA